MISLHGLSFSLCCLTAFAVPAPAALIEWRALWSGQSYDNPATATALILIDTDLWNASTPDHETASLTASGLLGLDLTITGATTGNGSFTEADFDLYQWDTLGFTLDLSAELLGQPLGPAAWGRDVTGATGDFNLISSRPTAPTGTGYFQLTTNGGLGDALRLTSLTAIPEPTAAWLASVLPALLLLSRRRQF